MMIAALWLLGSASVALAAPAFSTSGPLVQARSNHTTTLLPNGKLLVVGGFNVTTLATAELYNPATGTWTATGSLATARYGHSATLLANGKVLVAGGQAASYLASAELYDPATGTWQAAGNLTAARNLHTATLLPNGKVLVTGGTANGTTPLASANLYDPGTNAWTATSNLITARYNATATQLPNGTVLVAGGETAVFTYLSSAELYNPTTGTWTATGNLATARTAHQTTLLPNGKVLITGGRTLLVGVETLASTELYNPATGTWAVAGTLNNVRYWHRAALLPNGKVLVAGGRDGSNNTLASAELYNPATDTWSPTASLATARFNTSAALLPNGKVVVTGGTSGASYLASTEVYDSAAGSWAGTASLATARQYHSLTQLPNGKVLVVGGKNGSTSLATAALYDPALGTWAATASLSTARAGHTATLLPNGRVLVVGGVSGATAFSSAELYDPALGTWSATGNLTTARGFHTATLLPTGKVLIAAGYNVNDLSSAELYDPATGTCTATGSLDHGFSSHWAILMPNGTVLIGGNGLDKSSRLYDPATGSWSTTGSQINARGFSTATLLPNGKVLLAGGTGGPAVGILPAGELYDPATGTWSATVNLKTARSGCSATLLPNGKVLIAGGFDSANYLTSVEFYDPELGTWTATASLGAARFVPQTMVLPNGQVLCVGGENASGSMASTELYNVGLALAPSGQPQITGAFINASNQLVLTGTNFTGISEASGGSTTSSANNVPVVQVRSLDNQQVLFSGIAPATNWSATGVTTGSLASLPTGYAMMTVFTNGIPSVSTILSTALPTGPSVLSISPNKGSTAGGTNVTITGANFTGATNVTIGGVAATNRNVMSSSTITCTTPAGAAGTASVVVSTPLGTSAANSLFTYLAPPTVATIVPATGPAAGGASVTIYGSGFTGATGVTIGGTAATSVVVVNDATITCITGARAVGTASVVVTNPAGANAANSLYSYASIPIVTAISPSGGTTAGGTNVTITGSNFIGTTNVTIGGASATNINVVSATQILCKTPAHALGAASVLVFNAAGVNPANSLYFFGSPATISVSGLSNNIANGDTTPSGSDGTDFGQAVMLTAGAPHSFTIANLGGVPLNVNGVTISGAASNDFAVTTTPASQLTPSATTTFAISFQPTAPGLRSATVTIASDDPSTPSYSFTISGQGVFNVSPVHSIAFNPPASLYVGESPLTLIATANSDVPVQFSLVNPVPAGAMIAGNVLTITGPGLVKVQAFCGANGVFNSPAVAIKTINVQANPSTLKLAKLSQVYDGLPKPIITLGGAANITYKVGASFVSKAPSDAGSYAVKAVGATSTLTGTLVIAKAPLVVTLDNKLKLAGRPNPALTATYSGFFNGDNSSVITTLPVLKTTATQASAPGTYPITGSGGAAANYSLTFRTGNLTVLGFSGSYEALLNDSFANPTGKISLTVAANATNTFTGKLAISTEPAPLPFTGTLATSPDSDEATGSVTLFNKAGGSYGISITVSRFDNGTMSASVTGDSQLLGSSTKGRKLSTSNVLYAGAHTAVFEPAMPSGAGVPVGAGWATASISKTGVMTLAGRLGDGTAFTTALNPDVQINPGYRLFAQPYLPERTQSFIAGEFQLAQHPALGDRRYLNERSMTWQKVGLPADASYRAGFGPVGTTLMIDPWIAPNTTNTLAQRLGLTGTSFGITTSDPGSTSGMNLPSRLSLSTANKVSVLIPLANLTKWKTSSFNPANGTFTGSFELVDNGVKRTPTFSGVLRQPASNADMLIGDGHYLLAPLSGTEKTTGEVMFTRP